MTGRQLLEVCYELRPGEELQDGVTIERFLGAAGSDPATDGRDIIDLANGVSASGPLANGHLDANSFENNYIGKLST
jgi:hypothetical protein